MKYGVVDIDAFQLGEEGNLCWNRPPTPAVFVGEGKASNTPVVMTAIIALIPQPNTLVEVVV